MSTPQLSTISRRKLLTTAAGAAVALPWLWNRPAFAQENVVNVLAFGGYEEPGMLDAFTAETGITVNLCPRHL